MKYNGHKSQLGFLDLNSLCVPRSTDPNPSGSMISVRRSSGVATGVLAVIEMYRSVHNDWLVMKFLDAFPSHIVFSNSTINKINECLSIEKST